MEGRRRLAHQELLLENFLFQAISQKEMWGRARNRHSLRSYGTLFCLSEMVLAPWDCFKRELTTCGHCHLWMFPSNAVTIGPSQQFPFQPGSWKGDSLLSNIQHIKSLLLTGCCGSYSFSQSVTWLKCFLTFTKSTEQVKQLRAHITAAALVMGCQELFAVMP